MESRESLHACGSDLIIKCTIGKQLHDINFPNDLSCTGWYTFNIRTNFIFNCSHTHALLSHKKQTL